jgi:peroxiredoxin
VSPIEPDALKRDLANVDDFTPYGATVAIDAGVDELNATGTARRLAVGEEAPGFSLPDALGRAVSLKDRLAAGPVVLTFYRGDWCPHCNVYVRALEAALPEFKARGASLLAISAQSPDHALSLTEKAGLSYDVLSDVDQSVIRAYKLQFTLPPVMQAAYVKYFSADLRDQTADGTWQLPVTSTFVIDRDGIVRAAHVSNDYRTRMDPVDIVAALDALN